MGIPIRAFARIGLILLKNAVGDSRPPLIFAAKEFIVPVTPHSNWGHIAILLIATRANPRPAAVWYFPCSIEVRQPALIAVLMVLRSRRVNE